ncbi:MAG: hypothetical protein HDKAJFGB_03386 [Anaerolineae bacterium]|nr:hypothetical protein [Anaerolineae bacterium]
MTRDHHGIAIQPRPFIQVFLICIAVRLDTVVAPFQALLVPASQASQSGMVPAKGLILHIVTAVFDMILEARRIPMFSDQDGTGTELIHQCLRRFIEEEIGIHVGDRIDFLVRLHEVQRQSWTQGEVVLDETPIAPCGSIAGFPTFQHGQIYDVQVWRVQPTEDVGDGSIQCQHMETERASAGLQ